MPRHLCGIVIELGVEQHGVGCISIFKGVCLYACVGTAELDKDCRVAVKRRCYMSRCWIIPSGALTA